MNMSDVICEVKWTVEDVSIENGWKVIEEEL